MNSAIVNMRRKQGEGSREGGEGETNELSLDA
jgi:hypothetical protein